jgi:ABC-type uncharacterized transport system permease subunit
MRGLMPPVTAVAVAIAIAGIGVALMARTPEAVGQSHLEAPTREAGSLLLASSIPLLTYGLCVPFSLIRRL